MEFVNVPLNRLNKQSPDYDMELFWYGFKNLVKNYYSGMSDNGYIFSKEIDIYSDSLNELQKLEKYNEIYEKIHVFLKRFINTSFKTLDFYSASTISYLFTWLKRYNKIKDAPKFEVSNVYNKHKTLDDLTEDEDMFIKLKIIEFSVDKKLNLDLLKLYESNKKKFIEECIYYECTAIFDYISLRYNLNEVYSEMVLDIKGPIKLNKILKLIKS